MKTILQFPAKLWRYLNDVRRNAFAVSRLYGVPVWRIVREQIALHRRNGLRRDEYYKYHLFDPHKSWEDKCAFVSDVEGKRILREINPSKYYGEFKNKLRFRQRFEAAGIRMPRLVGEFWGKAEKLKTEKLKLGTTCGGENAEMLMGSVDQTTEGILLRPSFFARRASQDTSSYGGQAENTEGETVHCPPSTVHGLRSVADLQGLMDGLPEGQGLVFKPVEGSEGQMVMVFEEKAESRSSFAKASAFAKATADETADKKQKAEMLMGGEIEQKGTKETKWTVDSGEGSQTADCGLRSVSGELVTAEMLYARLTDQEALARTYCGGEINPCFLIEEYVRVHRALRDLCGKTLCTVRVVTRVGWRVDGGRWTVDSGDVGEVDSGRRSEVGGQGGGEEPESLSPCNPATNTLHCLPSTVHRPLSTVHAPRPTVLGAVFKLAPSEAGVDNLHAGGMSIGIDLETGALQQGRTMADMWQPYRSEWKGIRFEGRTLPYWKETLELAQKAALVFPEMPCVGWDIAITDDGPVVIEGNWGWALDLMQIGMGRGIWLIQLRSASYAGHVG